MNHVKIRQHRLFGKCRDGEDLPDILKEDPEIMVRKEAMGCTSCSDPLY